VVLSGVVTGVEGCTRYCLLLVGQGALCSTGVCSSPLSMQGSVCCRRGSACCHDSCSACGVQGRSAWSAWTIRLTPGLALPSPRRNFANLQMGAAAWQEQYAAAARQRGNAFVNPAAAM
jgi:hypothetical protein